MVVVSLRYRQKPGVAVSMQEESQKHFSSDATRIQIWGQKK